jgi:hypothetical protein
MAGWQQRRGMADETYPAWRELVQQTDRRLPPKMRKDLKPLSVWQPQRSAYVEALLNLLGASTGPEVVAELLTRLDAVLEFTISVTREFLLGHYNLESHQSDVFDHYQLQYLAMDRFVIVSNDRDLPTRTRRSPQSDRIMSFEHFLQTL